MVKQSALLILVLSLLTPPLSAAATDPGVPAGPSGGLEISKPDSLPDATEDQEYDSPLLQAQGGTPPYSWIINGLPSGMSQSTTGTELKGAPTAGSAGTYQVTAIVTDSVGDTAQRTWPLDVIDGSGAPVPLAIETQYIEAMQLNVPYESSPLEASGGQAPYTWDFSGLLSVGGLSATQDASGDWVISGTPTPGSPFITAILPIQLAVEVTVRDSSTPMQSVTKQLSPMVADGVFIDNNFLPPGVVGEPYEATLIGAGGTPPYTFGLSSGIVTNPSWLSVQGDKLVGVPPSAVAAQSVNLDITDSSTPPETSSRLVLLGVVQALTISADTNDGIEGEDYDLTVFSASGGKLPYTWQISGLPPGLVVTDGVSITGAYEEGSARDEPYLVTYSVTDSSAIPFTTVFVEEVFVYSELIENSVVLDGALVDEAYTSTLVTPEGGGAPFTFTPVDTLPEGLELIPTDANDGFTIEGIPTTSAIKPLGHEIIVNVADAVGQDIQIILNLPVYAKLLPLTSTLGLWTSGQEQSLTLEATGGVIPYTWNLSGLPSGLSVENGVLHGIPESQGAHTVSITVTDSGGDIQQSAFSILSLTVLAQEDDTTPLTFTTTFLPAGRAEEIYSGAIMSVSGGTAPYVWEDLVGLPIGLSATQVGNDFVLSGTPLAGTEGNYLVHSVVSDSSATPQTVETIYTMVIAPALESETGSGNFAGSLNTVDLVGASAAGCSLGGKKHGGLPLIAILVAALAITRQRRATRSQRHMSR